MRVNGKEVALSKNQKLVDFLEINQYDIRKIAIECNGEILPKSTYQEVILNNEDRLEIVRFVGGG
ncbi:sulfur carrier protein ThiS [Acetobacterium paludosum]|uniref:Sulfur carrier protein ThiS n=1 Tax=Acetobacterium paludosum TaxID=52693 RepID=A0A923HXK7_9FIRM|nr:sulfur carrier protein ThiS [Acetobacterium paludosum]MBC3888489.1 sulfur carrier protein ThiS [Acetobacterium paludosum]